MTNVSIFLKHTILKVAKYHFIDALLCDNVYDIMVNTTPGASSKLNPGPGHVLDQ